MGDQISRQAAIDAANEWLLDCFKVQKQDRSCGLIRRLEDLPSAQPESTRTFVELVVRYPDPELCTYKEYKGKPYYSIKYIENGETYVGYGTYNPEVLSQYLKEYFISSAQPDLCDGCDRHGASCVGEGCGKLEMPEVAKDTNVPINDTISRQSAIDAVNNIMPTKEGFLEPSEVLCELMQLPSAQPEETCDTCKYGYFGDGMCDYCRVRYQSHYERRTDDDRN